VPVDRFEVLGKRWCARMGARACAGASMAAGKPNGRRYHERARRALRVDTRGDRRPREEGARSQLWRGRAILLDTSRCEPSLIGDCSTRTCN
jgi:hypothetical protein